MTTYSYYCCCFSPYSDGLVQYEAIQQTPHPPPPPPAAAVKREPLLPTPTTEPTAMTAGYVTRPRDKLREELATSKQRRKEEKKRVKIESKIDRLQGRLAAVKVDKDEEKTETQKGHGK